MYSVTTRFDQGELIVEVNIHNIAFFRVIKGKDCGTLPTRLFKESILQEVCLDI